MPVEGIVQDVLQESDDKGIRNHNIVPAIAESTAHALAN